MKIAAIAAAVLVAIGLVTYVALWVLGRFKQGTERMGETPSLPPKSPISSKLLAVIGIVLVIAGGAAFLNSLGSGGGYLVAVLIISGVLLVLVALLRSVIRALR